MGELNVRLRTLLGALPIGLTRLGQSAVGPPRGWQWLPPAIPWLMAGATALAVGLLGLNMVETGRDYPLLITLAGALAGGIALFGVASALRGGAGLFVRGLAAVVGAVIGGLVASLLSEAITDAPFAFAVVAGALVGAVVLLWRLEIARSAHETAKSIGFVPALIWILLLLAAIPAIQAGAEIIVTRATVPSFVERQVGFSSSLVEIHGLALLPPYPAEAPVGPEGGPAPGSYRWFPLRGDLSDPRIALVRSQLDGTALERREIVARVRDDLDTGAVLDALRARGEDVPAPAEGPSLQGLAAEAAADAGGAQSIGSIDELAGLAPGSLVRVTLDFPGDAVAACVLAERCDARRLAVGIGPWLHVAQDPATGDPIIVQLPYPPTVAPMDVYGRQGSDDGAVSRFLDGPQVRQLLGWAQVLRGAIIDQDPDLPVDRLWLGPILFVVAAVLLGLGLWSGYPVFRATPASSGRWASADAVASGGPAGPIRAVASGYVAPPGRSPIDLDETPATLGRDGDDTVLTLAGLDPPLPVTVPRALGALSGMEAGELRYLRGRRPALRVGWYGSQVLLVFEDEAERDAAARLLSDAG